MRGGLILKKFCSSLVDFSFPPVCILCEEYLTTEAVLVCGLCWRRLPRYGTSDLSAAAGARVPSGIALAFSLWKYNEDVEQVIHEIKFFRKRRLAARVGAELGRLALHLELTSRVDIIVPVPLHRARQRQRGYNQSELLAAEVASSTGIELVRNALLRNRYTGPQSRLKATERVRNVHDAFTVSAPGLVARKRVLLIDDVLTTGSTLGACSQALHEAESRRIVVLTAAVSLPEPP